MITIILIILMMRVASMCDRMEEESLFSEKAKAESREKRDGGEA